MNLKKDLNKNLNKNLHPEHKKDPIFVRKMFWLILLATFLLYGNTLWNQYCLDDGIVITQNRFTQQGIQGIPDIFSHESFAGFFSKENHLITGMRYRPLSLATFALEESIIHQSPFLSHLVNVILFALTVYIIFLLVKKITKDIRGNIPVLPILIAALFLVHPIHTEVVANIKGRDEILALLFSLISCLCVLHFADTKKTAYLLMGVILWFIGLFSKENAFVFLGIIPLLLYVYGYRKFLNLIYVFVAFFAAGLFFLWIRQQVIGSSIPLVDDELMNNAYLHATSVQKWSTIFHTMLIYIRLLIFPHPLTCDYYPYAIPLSNWHDFPALLGLISFALITLTGILCIQKRPVISLVVALYLFPLLPVSNIFFPIGTMMNERFIYFSSLAYCIVLGWLGWKLFLTGKKKYVVTILGVVVFTLMGVKTFARNQIWHDNYTLFTTDVHTSENSAKGNCMAGGTLLESYDTVKDSRKPVVLQLSMNYLKKALTIYPHYEDAWLLLGNIQIKLNNLDSAMWYYEKILKLHPNNELARYNMMVLVNLAKDPDMKIRILECLRHYQPDNFDANYQLGDLYGKIKNDLERAVELLSNAVRIRPEDKNAWIDLGVAYGMRSEYAKSATCLEKALAIDPNDNNIYRNLGVTYRFLGNEVKAQEMFRHMNPPKN